MLNELFSIDSVVIDDQKGVRSIDRALQRAHELGWNQSEFGARMGVQAQHVTNWNKRGMPTDRLEQASKILGKSVDWLLGREKKNKTEHHDKQWPFSDSLFSDYSDLDEAQKSEIGEIVEDRIARFKAKNGPKRRRKSAEN